VDDDAGRRKRLGVARTPLVSDDVPDRPSGEKRDEQENRAGPHVCTSLT
jgi:hypothetical protein